MKDKMVLGLDWNGPGCELHYRTLERVSASDGFPVLLPPTELSFIHRGPKHVVLGLTVPPIVTYFLEPGSETKLRHLVPRG